MRATALSHPERSKSLAARCRSSVLAVGMAAAMTVSFAGTAAADIPGSPSTGGETPSLRSGNPTCATVMPGDFLEFYKQDPPRDETNVRVEATDPETNETLVGLLDVDVTFGGTPSEPRTFTFHIDGDLVVVGVLVKGGNNANFYDYRPGGVTDDGNLHAPLTDRGNPRGISHIEFCFGAVQEGALLIEKNSSKGGPVQVEGAKFAVTGPNEYSEFVTDTEDTPDGEVPDEAPETGVVCISGLRQGEYTVAETEAPEGYARDEDTKTAQVVPGTDCTDNRPTDEDDGLVAFENVPLADVDINITGQVPGEITSDIVCRRGTTVVGDSRPGGDPETLEMDDLPAGIYTCTLNIDP
ncbi:prealbumin-like fold domain-containing protein [Streptomyces sp. NBC_00287]|uniref:prealbumin-like fold domain-containing protein n=1 Tax=Streptomyces sp. NBC_00287 TaxID=2975702 RepID=UPI002E2B2DA9|nr:prealbumin-like fold domain-containing protein [Streptomyces sp. NBC_00287]